MNLESIPLQDGDGAYHAIIEASQGSRNKFKYDASLEAFSLTGVLPLGFSFPYDFGFLPSTVGGDGDPLDVLVLADETIPPGTVVPCRLVGVVMAEQRDADAPDCERNDRLIAVSTKSHRFRECESIDGVAANVLDEIEAFFVFYNQQKGGTFRPLGRGDRDAARRIVESAADRYRAERA